MPEQSPFKPAWWLRHRHAQTIWPNAIRQKPHIHTRRERINLPDGDFIDLDWTDNSAGPIVVVLHGLAGSIESHNVRGLLRRINAMGWRGVLMHFRSASGQLNKLPKSYHAGETADPKYIINLIHQREPETPLFACGFSIGGSALLNLLGQDHTLPLCAAVAVSVPYSLHDAADSLDKGFSRLYQRHMLSKLKSKAEKKFRRLTPPFSLAALKSVRNFREFDDLVTAPVHGFTDADEYYDKCSARQFLKSITIPTLLIHAKDDPFMSAQSIPRPEELSSSVGLELCNGGGHVGFVAGSLPWKPQMWLEQRISQFFSNYMDNENVRM